MKKIKRILVTALGLTMIFMLTTASSCEGEANKVNYNLKAEAENFNIMRRFAVINTRTDAVEFEMIGKFSREDVSGTEASIIVEMPDGTYRRHIVMLNDDCMCIIEDLGGAEVSKYHYEVHYVPESIIDTVIVIDD